VFDVAIAGAGPAGLELARRCCRSLDVVLIEEHRRPGKPNHCSGLVSRNVDMFFRPPKGCVEHRVRGAVLHPPSGASLVLKKKGFAAYVIDRARFDAALAEHAGCAKLMGSKLSGISFHRNGVELAVGKRRVMSRCIVGADGASSFVGKTLGATPKEKIPGVIAVTGEKNSSDFVELWFDKRLTDCFLWKIPRGETTEYGMWGSGSRYDVLEKFFSIRTKYEKRSGVIPLGPPKTYFNRAILLGDAAGQVKPWSGGGVVWGMMCAGIAADVLKKAADSGFSEDALREYERRWRKAIGRQLAAGMAMRKLYGRMSNSQVGCLMKTARYARLLNRLDMDFLVKR
jgi:geranylgeranyl reductase family protein